MLEEGESCLPRISSKIGVFVFSQGAPGNGGQVAVKSYVYTPLGDLQEVDECADGTSFATSYQYDGLGRQSLIRYPVVNTSQLAVGYHYTSSGYLQYLTDESTDYSVLWQAKAENVLGQVIDEQMKNGVEIASTRNSITGWLMASTGTAHADHDNVIQSQGYGYDEIGNLLNRNRNDAASGNISQESFAYDLTNRLTNAVTFTSSGPVSKSYVYDNVGNLTQKDNNNYTYGSGCQAGGRTAGPHAVCTVGNGTAYAYDDNGNLTSNGSRSVGYNPSNKVTTIETVGSGGASVGFAYGADGNRVLQTATSGGVTTRTVYVGLGATGKSLYERTTTPGATPKNVHFIYAGNLHNDNAFALRVLDDNGQPTDSKYYSFDHLGSVSSMSDDNGRVASVQSAGTSATVLSYDAWGARRNPDGTLADPASFPLPPGDREFTGQEQIPDVGLVNMNGRVYDPVLARFLSPDPNVQFTDDLQNYNRYSYVGNNPLRYNDPTGYFWSKLGNYFEFVFGNPLTDIEVAASIVACATTEVGCLALGLEFAALNAAIAISDGAGVAQTLFTTALGLGLGFVGGVEFGGPGGSPLANLIFGSASAAYVTAWSEGLSGRDVSGYDLLGAALLSAGEGAATLGLQKVIQLSQGNGEGADAAKKHDGTFIACKTGDPACNGLIPRTGTALLMSRQIDSSSFVWWKQLIVSFFDASHAGWIIETDDGTAVLIEAGCSGCDKNGQGGTLYATANKYDTVGDAAKHFVNENPPGTPVFFHGSAPVVLQDFQALIDPFNAQKLTYDWSGTNSNYFAHWFATAAGIPMNYDPAASYWGFGPLLFSWNYHPAK